MDGRTDNQDEIDADGGGKICIRLVKLQRDRKKMPSSEIGTGQEWNIFNYALPRENSFLQSISRKVYNEIEEKELGCMNPFFICAHAFDHECCVPLDQIHSLVRRHLKSACI